MTRGRGKQKASVLRSESVSKEGGGSARTSKRVEVSWFIGCFTKVRPHAVPQFSRRAVNFSNRCRARREHLIKFSSLSPEQWLKPWPDSDLDWLIVFKIALHRPTETLAPIVLTTHQTVPEGLHQHEASRFAARRAVDDLIRVDPREPEALRSGFGLVRAEDLLIDDLPLSRERCLSATELDRRNTQRTRPRRERARQRSSSSAVWGLGFGV